MSLSRLFNTALSTSAMLFNFNNQTNSDNDDDDNDGSFKSSIEWNKESIIGVSCLSSGIVLILAFLCVKTKRKSGSTYTYEALIKRSQYGGPAERMIVPALKINRELFAYDQIELAQLGEIAFLQKEITEIMHEKESRYEVLSQDSAITSVITTLLKEKEENDYSFDSPYTVTIFDYKSVRRGCRFFEFVMPPLTMLTIILEISFATIQDIATLDAQPSIFKLNKHDNFALNTSLVVYAMAWDLVEILYLSASQTFMSDLGSSIDTIFIKFFRKLTCKEPWRNKEPDPRPLSIKLKQYLAQSLLGLSILVNLFMSASVEYQTMQTVNQTVVKEGTVIPAWLLYYSSMTEYALSLLNDPSMTMTSWMMGCAAIDTYFNLKNLKEIKKEMEQSQLNNRESINGQALISYRPPSELKISIDSFGIFSPKSQASSASTQSPKIQVLESDYSSDEYKSDHDSHSAKSPLIQRTRK